MAYGFPLASDGWGRYVSFTTAKDFTVPKDILMNLQMETLLRVSDRTWWKENEEFCVENIEFPSVL
jgi:hypothetical protein